MKSSKRHTTLLQAKRRMTETGSHKFDVLELRREFPAGHHNHGYIRRCSQPSASVVQRQTLTLHIMKFVLLLALVAVAAAVPTPEAEADPAVLLYGYHHPLTYSIKPVEVKEAKLPLTYSYPGLGYPYSLGYPYGLGLGYPYGLPLLTKPAAEEPAAEAA
ncbi:uncharacterized protein [Panulirus ornatus]|uniref:uncharacterized protein n=1 Tax=Panulirus ornatus TaxID=150431 RepID=UPI003A836F49